MFPSAARAIRPSLSRFAASPAASPHPHPFSKFQYFKDHCFTIDVLPLWVLSAAAISTAGWFITRAAGGPDIIWDSKNNPTPWENVKPNQQVKLYAGNQKYDGEPYKRERL